MGSGWGEETYQPPVRLISAAGAVVGWLKMQKMHQQIKKKAILNV